MKFILANDLMYILSNRKKYLFLSIFVPFIICLLLSLNSSSDLSIMFYSLGNNLHKNIKIFTYNCVFKMYSKILNSIYYKSNVFRY